MANGLDASLVSVVGNAFEANFVLVFGNGLDANLRLVFGKGLDGIFLLAVGNCLDGLFAMISLSCLRFPRYVDLILRESPHCFIVRYQPDGSPQQPGVTNSMQFWAESRK